MIVSDYLVSNFADIMDYDFTANVEQDFDKIAEGDMAWNSVIETFYSPFHGKVQEAINDRQYNRISREIGIAPDGEVLVGKFGQYGPFVQKGPAEKKQFARLKNGQLIETITVEDALKLFELPRNAGSFEGIDIIIKTGRFGPYISFGESNVSLPRGKDPMKISLEECIALIGESRNKVPVNTALAEYKDSDITVLNGRYGAYIKHAGQNYRIPKGTDPASLTEEKCKEIISSSAPTASKVRRRAAKK